MKILESLGGQDAGEAAQRGALDARQRVAAHHLRPAGSLDASGIQSHKCGAVAWECTMQSTKCVCRCKCVSGRDRTSRYGTIRCSRVSSSQSTAASASSSTARAWEHRGFL